MIYIKEQSQALINQIENFFENNPDAMTITVLRWDEDAYIRWLNNRLDSNELRQQYESDQIKYHGAIKRFDKVKKICAIPDCGKEFEASKAAKFCSNACRQKNKYQKSKV